MGRKTVCCVLLVFSVSQQLSGVSGMANPIKWVRDRIAPRPRPEISKQEEAAARKIDEEKGQGSLFDAVPKLIEQQEKEAGTQPVVSKKVHTEVCITLLSLGLFTTLTVCSTNIRPRISKSRIENSTC